MRKNDGPPGTIIIQSTIFLTNKHDCVRKKKNNKNRVNERIIHFFFFVTRRSMSNLR